MASMPELKQNYPEYAELKKAISEEITKGKSLQIHKITEHPDYHYLETDITATQVFGLIRKGIDVCLLQDDTDGFALYRFANNTGGEARFIGFADVSGVSTRKHASLDDTKGVIIADDEE